MALFQSNKYPLSVLAILAAGAVSPVVYATSTLQGQVTNINGQPLSGVLVTVKETGQTIFTDQSGRYYLRNLNDDSTLIFQYLGLPIQEQPVSAANQPEQMLNIVLSDGSDQIERITVTGQREAQNRALNEYRASDAVANFIAADDMGQFVDQNVAESLQRLPGISISRDQGEGRFVSVRGIAPGLSTVTINGMRIGTPESGSRQVPLDVIPSGSVEGIAVVKAPTPDMPGDAIGGAVDIKSSSPFDRKGQQIRYRFESSYNELSGESSPKLQLNFSDVYDNNFGIAFGLNYLDRTLESDNIEAEYDELDGPNGDVFSIIEAQQRKYYVNRERIGANLNLEARPDNYTRYFANTVFSSFADAETRQRSIYVFEDGDLSSFDGANGVIMDMPEDAFRRRIRFRTKEQDTLAFSAGGEHLFDTWNLSYRGGISTTRERVLDENEGRYEYDLQPLDVSYVIGQGIPNFGVFKNGVADTTHLDNSNYALDRAVLEPKIIDDDEYSFGLDAEFPYAFGNQALTVKAGFDLRWKEKDVNVDEIELRRTPDARLNALTVAAPSYGLGNLGQGISSSQYIDFFNANRSAFTERPKDVEENLILSIAQDYVAKEDVMATYLMGTWDFERTRIIAGVRVENTKYSADGNAIEFDEDGDLTVNTRSVEADYTDVLPGLHIAYDIADDIILRGAWTNTIARPSFKDISPRAEINREDSEAELGNPDLKPYEAMNFDLVLDWYYGSGNVLSIGAFYKDIDNYVVELMSNNVADFPGFEVTRPTNSTSASVSGLEINWQHSVEEGAWAGLLVGANATLLDTELKLLERTSESFSLPDASETSGNLYVGYEMGPFSARMSYSYRDKFITSVGDDRRYDVYVAPHKQLDLTASYKFSKRLELVAELTNLTDEALELYQGSPNYTLQFEEYGPTFAFGIKGRF